MEYIALIEIAPILLLWMAPILALGFAVLLVLMLYAWFQDVSMSSSQ